jgi:hypothetical protein
MARKDPLRDAIKLARNLIQQILANAGKPSTESDGVDEGSVTFVWNPYGGLTLSGRTYRLYETCIGALLSCVPKHTDGDRLSREAVEHALKHAILRALRPRRPEPSDTRARFERRLSSELRVLRPLITAPPQRWTVSVQVRGFAARVLPLKFGAAEFVESNDENVAAVGKRLPDLTPRRRRRRAVVAANNKERASDRLALRTLFADGAIATVQILANDKDAAFSKGLAELRRTVDIVNFFAPFLDQPRARQGRVVIAPDRPDAFLAWTVSREEPASFNSPSPWRLSTPRPEGIPVATFALDSQRAREVGLLRVHELLAREGRSDLEERIVMAVSWAGRAAVEHRKEHAFLLYAIALEALLAKKGARSGVTERLQLRASYVLSGTPKGRQKVFDLVGELYEIRSAIVHTGDAPELDKESLKLMSEVVDAALQRFLLDDPFASMRRATELEAWFDRQRFGADGQTTNESPAERSKDEAPYVVGGT